MPKDKREYTTVSISPEEIEVIQAIIRKNPHRWLGKAALAKFVHEAIREKVTREESGDPPSGG